MGGVCGVFERKCGDEDRLKIWKCKVKVRIVYRVQVKGRRFIKGVISLEFERLVECVC